MKTRIEKTTLSGEIAPRYFIDYSNDGGKSWKNYKSTKSERASKEIEKELKNVQRM